MHFVIRTAGDKDIQNVVDLAVEMVRYSSSPLRNPDPEQVRRYRREDLQILVEAIRLEHNRVFLAEKDDRLIGHVIVTIGHRDSSTGHPQAWVFDLSVKEEFWGTGVAQALMREAERFAKEHGMNAIGLGVTLANERALQFYRNQGYLDERLQMVKLL